MDDSNTPDVDKSEHRIPLGMTSFDQNEREQFGRNVRLAMGFMEGTSEPVKGKAMPEDVASIRQRLKSISQDITSHHADLLELLVRFDDLEGWKSSGANHCAAWMNLEIGIGKQSGWEYLRVGRKLRSLPTLKALFRAGKLTWSKVRLITRVADENNEKILCHAALDASVSDVERLCQGYRWNDDDNRDGENDQALQQRDSRSLTWNEASNGSTRIQLILPPEIAQAYLNSIEHSLNQLEDDTDSKISQRRADAAVLMAETSLQSAGREIATADRYQVIVSVDASELPLAGLPEAELPEAGLQYTADGDKNNDIHIKTPSKRPTVKGAGAIALDTARRITCDCSITINKTAHGEPVDIGRKSRIWPHAMARAIKERDQHCVWPGCTHTHHLHIHHITHWADGGTTSVENGACLCSLHHSLVHEGGFTIERVENDDMRLHEQFMQQQHSHDISMFDFEKELRNDKASFNKVRTLIPTSYRFRVVDAHGKDIRDHSSAGFSEGKTQSNNQSNDYTRVYCAESVPDYYDSANCDRYDSLCTYDVAEQYAINSNM